MGERRDTRSHVSSLLPWGLPCGASALSDLLPLLNLVETTKCLQKQWKTGKFFAVLQQESSLKGSLKHTNMYHSVPPGAYNFVTNICNSSGFSKGLVVFALCFLPPVLPPPGIMHGNVCVLLMVGCESIEAGTTSLQLEQQLAAYQLR